MNNFTYLVAILALALTLTGCGTKSYLQSQTDEAELEETEAVEAEESSAESDTDGTYWVQVDGAVVTPGVYEVQAGSRVYQVIELAGGLTEEAYTRSLNQVRLVEDGEMIYVSTEAEATAEASTTSGEVDDGLININTATVDELQTLPGIGESKAQAIVDYRETYGSFASAEDITSVSGIGDSTYAKLAAYIKAE